MALSCELLLAMQQQQAEFCGRWVKAVSRLQQLNNFYIHILFEIAAETHKVKFYIHLLFAKNGSKHKCNKSKIRACANYNRSWFQV